MVLKQLALALCFLASQAQAKIYYVNKGVRYHIGDDKYNSSNDSTFIDAYPVVGKQWIQPFQVTQEDTIKIHVDKLWGVDDCPYCKDMISIDTHDMGRLSAANNHEAFDTLKPLAFHAYPGHTYYLKIESFGTPQADDFVFEGVRVETEVADVIFPRQPIIKDPGDPMHVEHVDSPCEGARQVSSWIPDEFKASGRLEFSDQDAPCEQDTSASLAAGDFVQFYAKVDETAGVDGVSQALEILLGDPESGWVLSFIPGGTSLAHGNLSLNGHYMSDPFGTGAWKTSAWNQIKIARCEDGRAHLWINGDEMSQSLDQIPQQALQLKIKALGVTARLADQPY